MSDRETIRQLHTGNDTPLASDEGILRLDRDTPYHGRGSMGVSIQHGVRPDRATGDEKTESGGTPVLAGSGASRS